MGIRMRARHFVLGRAALKHHTANLAALEAAAAPPKKVLFLCYGNICRSPVAEVLARESMSGVEVASAGFFETTGRRTPPHILEACESLGLSLPRGRSKRVTAAMVNESDLVLLHDLENFQMFKKEFPNALGKMLLLGMFLDPPQPAIRDPYIADSDEATQVVRQIRDAVIRLSERLNRRS
jgi:protein-tyrosine phosphatase